MDMLRRYHCFVYVVLGFTVCTFIVANFNFSFSPSHVFTNHKQHLNIAVRERPRVWQPTLPIDCVEISKGNETEVNSSRSYMASSQKRPLAEAYYLDITRNCADFREERLYWSKEVTAEEMQFPLAFGIVAYTDIEYLERLLRIIYRPHNFYAIHVDAKASASYKQALSSIASCFQNVAIVAKPVSVLWGEISVIEAELLCMRTLWPNKGWKYFINLTGQEFPLKTNLEMVRNLRNVNGEDILDASVKEARRVANWYQFHWIHRQQTGRKKPPPPHGITMAKGEAHVIISRPFVQFIINDNVARDLLEWSRDIWLPDEFYFSSLYFYRRGNVTSETVHTASFPVRHKLWMNNATQNGLKCGGKIVRGICVFGITDLPSLLSSKPLFANKFMMNVEPLAYDCLERILVDRSGLLL